MEATRFEIFEKRRFLRKSKWYWRLVAPNNEIVAVGAEPFTSYEHALRAIKTVRSHAAKAVVKREVVS